jgi:hypothetical protein
MVGSAKRALALLARSRCSVDFFVESHSSATQGNPRPSAEAGSSSLATTAVSNGSARHGEIIGRRDDPVAAAL